MSPEQDAPSESRSITSRISSTFRLIREFPSIYVQSLREVLAERRELQKFRNSLEIILCDFTEELAQARSQDQGLTAFSNTKNKMEDILLHGC